MHGLSFMQARTEAASKMGIGAQKVKKGDKVRAVVLQCTDSRVLDSGWAVLEITGRITGTMPSNSDFFKVEQHGECYWVDKHSIVGMAR